MEPLREIRAVTFDVGGTLIAPWPSVGHVYGEVAARHGWRELDVEKLNKQFAAAWRSKSSFDYSRPAWARLVARTFNHGGKPGDEVQFFDELYERFAQPESWSIYEDVLPVLDLLMERGVDLGIISNWDERLRPLLKRLRLDGYFRVIIISDEIGFQKPSDVMFREAVRKFTCPAACVLHVGDGEVEDVEGARQAGLHSVLLRRKGNAPGENALTSLSELGRLLH